jgi:acyl-coenzyme A thioesterase PaaI-like protein
VVSLHRARDNHDPGFGRLVFGGRAGALTHETVRWSPADGGWLEVVIRLPSSLRSPREGWGVHPDPRGAGGEDGRLGIGGALALFDEVSSYAIMLKDWTHRPGSTISLVAHRATGSAASAVGLHGINDNNTDGDDDDDDAAGWFTDRVVVRAHATKCGKTIGFARCELVTESGALLFIGEHTKYLLPTSFAMSVLWDWTVGWCRSLGSIDWPGLSSAAARLGLIGRVAPQGAGGPSAELYSLSGVTSSTTAAGQTLVEATVQCERHHLNPLGVVHGGFVTVVLGEMGWLAAAIHRRSAVSDVVSAQSFVVRFLSGTSKRFRVVATTVVNAGDGGGGGVASDEAVLVTLQVTPPHDPTRVAAEATAVYDVRKR